jgi:hypothetical protein
MQEKSPNDYDPLLQFFAFAHLPEHLKKVSEPFAHLALHLSIALPRNPERTVALRKLLEAKDCAVRAKLFKAPQDEPASPYTFPLSLLDDLLARGERLVRKAAPAADSADVAGPASVFGKEVF